MNVTLWYSLKPGSLIPPFPFFFLRTVLASQGLCVPYRFIYLFIYLLFRATPAAYGGSQARGQIILCSVASSFLIQDNPISLNIAYCS